MSLARAFIVVSLPLPFISHLHIGITCSCKLLSTFSYIVLSRSTDSLYESMIWTITSSSHESMPPCLGACNLGSVITCQSPGPLIEGDSSSGPCQATPAISAYFFTFATAHLFLAVPCSCQFVASLSVFPTVSHLLVLLTHPLLPCLLSLLSLCFIVSFLILTYL